jgi:ribosomal-protein-alanine N-acetyltransferase
MAPTDFLIMSARLGFRLLEDADFESLETLDTDPEVRAHFPDGVSTSAEIRRRIARSQDNYRNRGYTEFAVVDLESGEFAGRAGFGETEGGEIEVGYVFLKDFWGRGLAQESLRALLAWAEQNLEIPRIIAYAPKEHSASFNVMKKSGMRYFRSGSMRGVECDFYEYPL